MSDNSQTPPAIRIWDERFSTDEYVYGTAPNDFLVRVADQLPGQSRILAIADGEGRNGVWLAKQGHNVHSVDGSRIALEKARALAQQAEVSIELEQADLLHWRWPKSQYDAVVAIFIQFAGPEARRRLFENAISSLKPGGLFMLQGYRTEQLAYGTGGPPQEENLYTEQLLKSELSGLDVLVLRAHDSVISEGMGHSGMSALIDYVGRKP
ncbi:SAM-dependent methyltransferase [Oceanicaulis alexandrii]|uniref:SAM-dependent methyltransferase n=1 Tax=Oceanicaulis alexandrii TaxID=153233 RepID=UPI0003B4314D|nr:class I SAM-dependent methyltransferase [Oceanicaulis alexandrii]